MNWTPLVPCLRCWLRLVIVSSLLWGACAPTWASSLRRTAIVKAVAAARPAVVNINGQKTLNWPEPSGSAEAPRRVNGMGTGIVIDSRGYIITNFQVVEGVREIKVTLQDGRAYVARLVAHDPLTDLAVIRATGPIMQVRASCVVSSRPRRALI